MSSDVQETRGSKRTGPLSDAEKATRALAQQAREKQKAALNDDIDTFVTRRDELIHDLALKHHKKEEYIRSLLLSESQYTKTRAPSLRNAVIHHLSEMSKAAGHNFQLPELQKRADSFLLEGISEEEQARLKAALVAHRQLSTKGLRATHIGAAVDSRSVASHSQDELRNLYERTGTRAFAFFTRGGVDDAFMPTFAASGDSAAFCVEVLKKPAVDILRMFEAWSITRDRNLPERDDTRSVRKQITAAIEAGLHHGERHRENVVHALQSRCRPPLEAQAHWVARQGHIPKPLARINSVEVLRRLRDDLHAGLIYWETLNVEEARAVQAEVDAIRAANNGQAKPRRPRADIGGKHISAGRREQADDDDSDRPDSDDDYDEGEGNGYGDNDDARAEADRATRGTDLVAIPRAALGDATNTTTTTAAASAAATNTNAAAASAAATAAPTAQKRKASTQGGAAAKKPRTQSTPASASAAAAPRARKVRKDKGIPRGPKGSKESAAPSTSAGPGRDDEVTRGALQKMAQRRAATAAASMASQLPPTA
ncbi:hypothetical protein C8F04DRAFT_1193768 [Mycena alexandri]|uniref:Uncharacterized protein n=1 Tax=Mycena alexandri TaxID=1745969 RepID=A0AAD6WQ65_9AGAR|nr:hypothetical protein C8F04DRAFT_1193768 [Mycena alexandri]